MGSWRIISWNMYINMATSKLLIPTHCTHTEIFLKEAGIISTKVNVTFDEFNKIFQFDLEDASNELGINKDWEPQNQVMIDQRKKQLEQRLLPIRECICEYNKPGKMLYK